MGLSPDKRLVLSNQSFSHQEAIPANTDTTPASAGSFNPESEQWQHACLMLIPALVRKESQRAPRHLWRALGGGRIVTGLVVRDRSRV
jgi:hypothetical protein